MKHSESRARNAAIRAAIERGEPREAVASKYQVSNETIRRAVKGRQTAPVPRLPTQREIRMAAMYGDGLTLEQIGSHFCVSRERVRQIIKRRFGMTRLDGGCAARRLKVVPDLVEKIRAKQDKRELKAKKIWDMTHEQYVAHVAAYGSSSINNTPMQKFIRQRTTAKSRGIDWEITFREWWNIWQESGHWSERGRGTGYCMARYGDSGPYSVANVYICTISQNFSDSYLVDHPKRKRSRGFGLSKYAVASGEIRYVVRLKAPVDGKIRFGAFRSLEDALQFGAGKVAA